MVISPTILLCDDAAGFRVMLGTMLSDAGLDVSVACTWDDAATRATQRQPDAILVDLWMPTYDPALLRGLRACSPGSAVVVVSALSVERSALAVSGIEGISAVVSKRDRPEVIVAAVIDALREPDRREPSIGRLRAEAARASERLSIYRHKTLLGSGDRQGLAERQRVARTARDRLRHASRRASSPER